ncbi:helix-turn-helix domain-containing protein [Actinoplanes sp. NPDC051861]|uniref:helix-turn-helix domain-containing protein n=1 Tax=Actinoplanes sp. NPDC051861 TaxID=3155170 RepID=UPI003413D99E
MLDRLAATLHAARTDKELSVNALADRSGVSRAMIGKIERGEAQPTAALLGRLAAALGMTLSELFARTEGESPRLARLADQTVWVDPETGYRRRSVSPAGGAVQLVEVELPAGARVAYPADSYAVAHHQIYVLDGRLRFQEGDVRHDLERGDCLELGAPVPCAYENVTDRPCRYLVVLSPRRSR